MGYRGVSKTKAFLGRGLRLRSVNFSEVELEAYVLFTLPGSVEAIWQVVSLILQGSSFMDSRSSESASEGDLLSKI